MMDISLSNLIKPELLVLIPVCWGIGLLIRSTKCSNQKIPFINALCSILLAALYLYPLECANFSSFVFGAITQGLGAWIIAWVSYDKVIKQGVLNDMLGNINNTDSSDKG